MPTGLSHRGFELQNVRTVTVVNMALNIAIPEPHVHPFAGKATPSQLYRLHGHRGRA